MKRRQQAAKQRDSEEAPQEMPKGMVAMNVLLVLGHPRKNSLGGALYEAFRAGLRAAGVPHRELIIADLDFDPDVHEASPSDQCLEADIQQAQVLISGH